jgi:ferredoxin
MPKKYHINTKTTFLDLDYIYKFKIERGENCINCGKCTKVCIYEAHKRDKDDSRKMADPNTVVCRNCFRCIQECPRGALEKSLDKDFCATGGKYWKPDILISLWKQAEDGKVPVSGAGYRGPFTGPGFDSMWTDMSEIVRPTRDGIHGREYINTAVDLGRKLNHLTFNSEGQLTSTIRNTVDLPIPILFDIPARVLSSNVIEAMLKAAAELKIFVMLRAAEIDPSMYEYIDNIIPVIEPAEIEKYEAMLKKARLIAIEYSNETTVNFSNLQQKIKKFNQAPIITRVPAAQGVEDVVSRMAHSGAEIVQILADYRGQEQDSSGKNRRFLKDVIRAAHLKLVEDGIRDEITIIASGGIALAEHVTKAMLCGADLTAIDIPLLVALGLRIYEEPDKRLTFPEGLEKTGSAILAQRIVNLIGAWHSQILEMMGAMGIREARRLRGESGRAIFFDEIDKDTFGKLFKRRKEASYEAINH